MTRRPAWLAWRSILLIAIVLLAALLRIAAIAYTHGTQAAPEENRLIARNLAAGRGFTFTEFGVTGPTAIRGPAYPMLLAVVGPDRVGLILAINVVAGAASVVAAAALTKRLLSPLPNPLPVYRERGPEASSATATPRAAWIAAVLFAIWPTQLYAATLTQGLSIAVFLTLAAFTLAWHHTPPALIAAGLLAALAALTEPVLALPLLLSALVLGWRRHWPDAALFVGTAMVLIAPWLYRNAVIFGAPMPITSNFWRDAFLGNGGEPIENRPIKPRPLAIDGTTVAMSSIDMLSPREFDQLKQPEPKRVRVLRGWTIDAVRQHPVEYMRRCWKRLLGLLFGQFEHRYAGSCLMFFIPSVLLTALLILPRFQFALRSTMIVFGVGFLLPMIFIRSEARMIPLLEIPLLLAWAGTERSKSSARSAEPEATKSVA